MIFKLLGSYKLDPYPGNDYLWILDNPPRLDMFRVELETGKQIVPCHQFVTDLSSSPKFAWAIYPPMLARDAAILHDWGAHVSRVSEDELMIELNSLFDYWKFDITQSLEYVRLLKSLPKEFWHELYFDISGLRKVPMWKRVIAWCLITVWGWVAWGRPDTGKTQKYREYKLKKIIR